MTYKLAQNTISNEDIDSLVEWLKTYPPLTMPAGSLTKKFEEEWSKKIGVKYSVFCNSGSSANLLAYSALSYKYSDLQNVFLSASGWATTLSPILQLDNLFPFVLEVDKDTFGIDIVNLKYVLEHNLDTNILVVLVHTLGIPNNMDAILELQKKYNFLLMEDCCPAVGSKYKNRYVGTFGNVSTFSLYYGHQLSTIEGGMVCTNDEELYNLLLMLRSHGWSKDLSKEAREILEKKWDILEHHSSFTFYVSGYNLRPTEINSFLGLKQVNKLDEVVSARNERFWYYHRKLKNYFIVPNPPEDSTVSCITFPCICFDQSIDSIVSKLKKNNIETRPISGGSLGKQPMFQNCIRQRVNYPFADLLDSNGFVLPCHPEISFEDIDFICNLLIN